MSNTPPPVNSKKIGAVFAQLSQQDVEEFYLGYQYWNLQRQIEILQNRLNQTRRLINENTERMGQVQPTAIELATLARLQSNGVSDVNLLDRMLERGELWLDRTMQRLDYLEQLDDFIRDDYTQWCQLALEGAYDWIDSVLDADASSTPPETTEATTTDLAEDVKQEGLLEATEELFFQKISTEDELHVNEITLKRPSISPPDLEEVAPPPEEMRVGVEEATASEGTFDSMEEEHPVITTEVSDDIHTEVEASTTLEETAPIVDETHSVEISEDTKPANHEEETHLEATVLEESLSTEDSLTYTNTQPPVQKPIEKVAFARTPSTPSTRVSQDSMPPRRPGLMKRFLGKIWGS